MMADECSSTKPVIVGIYGLPGAGKSHLFRELKREIGVEDFEYHEGSAILNHIVPGGLAAFQACGESEKASWRERAIEWIKMDCINTNKVGVIAGHFMFWNAGENEGKFVFTQKDLDTFTHIIYLDVPAEVIAQRRSQDTNSSTRIRQEVTEDILHQWKEAEKSKLRGLCYKHNILFINLIPDPASNLDLTERVSVLLRDFRTHNEQYNITKAEERIDDVVVKQGEPETMLVFDADKTLAADDSGKIFWDLISNTRGTDPNEFPLKTLFQSPLGYSYTAFRQATLLYEETGNEKVFDDLCETVSSSLVMHPKLVTLLKAAMKQKHVGAVIITCGLARVWEKVIKREGLSGVIVIGGGRISDNLVVTADVKSHLLARLRYKWNVFVWAFGDSVLDLPMLAEADRAVVAVGEAKSRSHTMDSALRDRIENLGLKAHQALLPGNASPRLNTRILPIIRLQDDEVVKSMLCVRERHELHIRRATNSSAIQLLSTPLRDAVNAGPILREYHQRVGWFLAIECLGNVVGLEEYPIRHVQGTEVQGSRLLHEAETSIVALMRGGEPMAFGVNEAFPLAMFVHADSPQDVKPHHLMRTIILVDSVVNSGKTVVDFVQHIRRLSKSIRIVVVTGVAQKDSVSADFPGINLFKRLDRYADVSLVALRVSDNKFTGKGTTDTGNRLFNTTSLD